MKFPNRGHKGEDENRHPAIRRLTVAIASILLSLIVAEAAFRGRHLVKYTLKGNSVAMIAPDAWLGWVAKPNYHFDGVKVDAAGRSRPVRVRLDHRGFRAFSDPAATGRLKLLVLGDSFTHALDVSDDETYYAVIRRQLPIELFACGVNGYGSLQETLLLEQVDGIIQPDAILLQFCPNDFINNHYDLERLSLLNNNGMKRPYLSISGELFRATPKAAPVLFDFANHYSRLLHFFLHRYAAFQAARQGFENSIEKTIARQGRSCLPFAAAVRITDLIFARLRAAVGPETPVYAFITSEHQPYHGEFNAICDRHGIGRIDSVPRALAHAEDEGESIRAGDGGHWNPAGHAIAGRAIAAHLIELADPDNLAALTLEGG